MSKPVPRLTVSTHDSKPEDTSKGSDDYVIVSDSVAEDPDPDLDSADVLDPRKMFGYLNILVSFLAV